MSRSSRFRDPQTKREVIDRMLSFDFTGDIRDIGEGKARLERVSPQSFLLTFPSGRTYEFVVRIPRDAGAPLIAERTDRVRRAPQERSFSPADGYEPPSLEEVQEDKKPQTRRARRSAPQEGSRGR